MPRTARRGHVLLGLVRRHVRPLWTYLVAAAAAITLAVFVVSELGEPDLIPVGPSAGGVTIAGQLMIEPSAPTAGGTVAARATISADRVITLRGLTVKVRDEAGAFHDFPEQTDVELTTVSREIEWYRRFDEPGNYTYYLAYRLDGDEWVNLPPWQQVTVR